MLLTPLHNLSKKHLKLGISICDAYAMAIALDQNIGLEPYGKNVCVELSGFHSRGHLVVDHYKKDKTFFPVVSFKSFDFEKYVKLLEKSIE